MKILVVDDEVVSRKKLKMLTQSLGYTTISASNGEDAWTLWQREKPQIVISDWIMPGMSGLDLCRKIRESSSDRYTFLIIVTVLDSKDSIITGMNAGADDYVTKPYNKEELRVRIKAFERIIQLQDENNKTKNLLESIINNNTSIIYIKNLKGQYLLVNNQFEKLLKKNRAQILEKTDKELFSTQIVDIKRKYHENVLSLKKPFDFEETIVIDEHQYTYLTVMFPLYEKNTIYAIGSISTDISKRKMLEHERLNHEKLEGVIETAGAICHELNQPLQTISGYTELLMLEIKKGQQNYESLTKIKGQVERMVNIIRKLMSITEYETKEYIQGRQIIDIDKSSSL